jgi:hypothetical protein
MSRLLFIIFTIFHTIPSAISTVEDDFYFVERLSDIYNYGSVSMVLDNYKIENVKKFMKTSTVQLQCIAIKEDWILTKQLLVEKRGQVFISLLNEDDLTLQLIDSALQTNSSIFSETIWFVKVKDKNKILNRIGNILNFDSNLYLLVDVEENVKEMIEVYAIKQNPDGIMIHTNTFGIWANNKLVIEQPNKWDRRTDLFGTNLRYNFLKDLE